MPDSAEPGTFTPEMQPMEHPSQYQKLDSHTSTNPGVASDATPRHLIIIHWAMLACLLAIATATLALAVAVGRMTP
jgi:hypothetical protein